MSVFLPHLKLIESRNHVCLIDPEMIFDLIGVFQVEKGMSVLNRRNNLKQKYWAMKAWYVLRLMRNW